MNDQTIRRLQQLTKVRTKKELTEWGLWLLQWAVHQHQRGCTIIAVNDHAHIRQELDFPLLQQIDLQATTAPLSEFPAILGEHTKHLIENERIDEAEEVVQIIKTLQKSSKGKATRKPKNKSSVSSTMNLEAAKIMAKEGDPRTAATLVEKTDEEASSKKKS
jgi:hypothetical protein